MTSTIKEALDLAFVYFAGSTNRDTVREAQAEFKEIETELEFLRFFYARADDVMGPASDDVYQGIKDEWVATGHTLPESY